MKLSKIFSLFILCLLSSLPSFGEPIQDNFSPSCAEFNQAEQKVREWEKSALAADIAVGCPSFSADSPFTRLEEIAWQDNECGRDAKTFLTAVYGNFSNHPLYATCGFMEHRRKIMATTTKNNEKLCAEFQDGYIHECFFKIAEIIIDLKKKGENKEAFELAQRSANSYDTTGISQFTLAAMYQFGHGTEKNLHLAIRWHKEALERLEAYSLRVAALTSISVAYEDVGDYASALTYFRQCAAMKDETCQQAVARVTPLVSQGGDPSLYSSLKMP